jgi:galactokinase/mevalonate kinase-like predicted kinase
LKISCVPLKLTFRYGGTEVPELSLNGRNAVLRDLVNKLNTWYTYMRRQPRKMTNAVLVADLHFH